VNTILVIEDEAALRQTIVEMLEYEGFSTLAARDGQIGLELAKKHLPDLILCDVMMPIMDGHAVLQALQKNSATAAIPFLFLTARTSHDDVREGMDLGADDYLTKPFSVKQLISAVNARITRKAIIVEHYEKEAEDLRHKLMLMLPHELRTPMTSIMGYSEMLMHDGGSLPEADVLDFGERIFCAAQRLYRLVENYLAYSQTEVLRYDTDQRKAFQQQRSDAPNAIVHEIAVERATHYDRMADLDIQFDDVPAVQVYSEHLKKIAHELIDNAFKFSKPGTPIHLRNMIGDHHYSLMIHNEGRGMAPEEIANIGAYEQFNRDQYEQQGAGLGLIIAYRLAELYGGRLMIDSDPGAWLEVRAQLPLPFAKSTPAAD
jgi:two-component system sensor histidine kinase/response regulator